MFEHIYLLSDILSLAFGGPYTSESVFALPKEIEQCSNPLQGQSDCKVEAHVDLDHVPDLLSTRDDGPVCAGPLLRLATLDFPCSSIRASVKPR
jgi:hypothetical protein